MDGDRTVYDMVGEQYFVDLVGRFYQRVAADPVLAPLYPEDLSEPRRNTAGFLIQYWGGPAGYSERRGHPRLRMRHAPFAIGARERQAWFDSMSASVRESDAPEEVKAVMIEYFEHAAAAMVNRPG